MSNSLSTAYQDAIESGDKAKIKTVLNKMFMKAVELQIITEVDDSKEAIQTTINLLDGDIASFVLMVHKFIMWQICCTTFLFGDFSGII